MDEEGEEEDSDEESAAGDAGDTTLMAMIQVCAHHLLFVKDTDMNNWQPSSMFPRLFPPNKTTIQTIWTRGFHILMLIARTITRRRSERTGHVSMLRHSRFRRPQTSTSSSSRLLQVRARRPSSYMRIRALSSSSSSQSSISKAPLTSSSSSKHTQATTSDQHHHHPSDRGRIHSHARGDPSATGVHQQVAGAAGRHRACSSSSIPCSPAIVLRPTPHNNQRLSLVRAAQ